MNQYCGNCYAITVAGRAEHQATEEEKQMNGHPAAINGDPAALEAERAVEELRRGRVIQLFDGDQSLLIAAMETLEPPLFERLRSLRRSEMALLITSQRSEAMQLAQAAPGPVAISFPSKTRLEQLRAVAGVHSHGLSEKLQLRPLPAENPELADAGFRLAKLGKLLPALLAVRTAAAPGTDILNLSVSAMAQAFRDDLSLISRARVPLVHAVDTDIVLFRQRHGFGEHLAILIGDPNLKAAVPVRLHSACLTGDVLGSLRCDCGDQLKRAVSRMVSLGGGVLLYLDQEGRGIGLANKLRAYDLQDAGLDTLDADKHLGFLPDERTYDVAALMLRELGIQRIRLLTNNPYKIRALTQLGIQVAGRMPLVAPVNTHNQRYLQAKLDRAGHLAE